VIIQLLLGFFEVIPSEDSPVCAWLLTDAEVVREIWVHEVRRRWTGWWLNVAGALQLRIPFRWLSGLASDPNLNVAVELVIEKRFTGALCGVDATGFGLTRTRPARALARWSRTMSLAAILTPSLPPVPPSMLLAGHVSSLPSWEIPCDEPNAMATGRAAWADSTSRIDISSWAEMPADRVSSF
jgi:hypothetical protein